MDHVEEMAEVTAYLEKTRGRLREVAVGAGRAPRYAAVSGSMDRSSTGIVEVVVPEKGLLPGVSVKWTLRYVHLVVEWLAGTDGAGPRGERSTMRLSMSFDRMHYGCRAARDADAIQAFEELLDGVIERVCTETTTTPTDDERAQARAEFDALPVWVVRGMLEETGIGGIGRSGWPLSGEDLTRLSRVENLTGRKMVPVRLDRTPPRVRVVDPEWSMTTDLGKLDADGLISLIRQTDSRTSTAHWSSAASLMSHVGDAVSWAVRMLTRPGAHPRASWVALLEAAFGEDIGTQLCLEVDAREREWASGVEARIPSEADLRQMVSTVWYAAAAAREMRQAILERATEASLRGGASNTASPVGPSPKGLTVEVVGSCDAQTCRLEWRVSRVREPDSEPMVGAVEGRVGYSLAMRVVEDVGNAVAELRRERVVP